jgi:hypothetical protein
MWCKKANGQKTDAYAKKKQSVWARMQVATRTTYPAKVRPLGRPTLKTVVKTLKTVSTLWRK